MSSDWSDTMVWFGQILLYLCFYHPIDMILVCERLQNPIKITFDEYLSADDIVIHLSTFNITSGQTNTV